MTGDELRLIRKTMGLSQNVFMRELGMQSGHNYCSDMERGVRPITDAMANHIALLYKVWRYEQAGKPG